MGRLKFGHEGYSRKRYNRFPYRQTLEEIILEGNYIGNYEGIIHSTPPILKSLLMKNWL